MISGDGSPGYDARLRAVLAAGRWEALRDFARAENQVPEDLHADDAHFWEVLLHKLICNRFDLPHAREESLRWLADRGYSADLGGF